MSDTTPRVGPEAIRAYVLDEPLDEGQRHQVERELGVLLECVAVTPLRVVTDAGAVLPDTRGVRPLLRAAGIAGDIGRRTVLVAPADERWRDAIAEAIARETGRFPILVETPHARAGAGDPGPLRVVDLEDSALGGSPD